MTEKSTPFPDFCFAFNSRCLGEACGLRSFIPEDAETCPIGLEPKAIEAMREAMETAAEYVKSRLSGIEAQPGEDLLDQIVRGVRDGKIEWKDILEDLSELDS